MAEKPKNKRVSLTLKEKVDIIHAIEGGKETISSISKDIKKPRTTLQTIWAKKDDILKSYEDTSSKFKKVRKVEFANVDEALLDWFKIQRNRNIPIGGPILLSKAKEFAVKFNCADFKASNGWLEKWKARHEIKFKTISGEGSSADLIEIDEWLKNKWPIISNGFEARNIYNADETGLFFRALPKKGYHLKGENCIGGKNSKERITALLCANMDGSDKLTPLIIGKSKNPRCFKKIGDPTKLKCVNYYSNKKAWMTTEICKDWLEKLDKKLRKEKRQILLLLDNCSSHPKDLTFTNIKLEFFPANATSKLQPMDQGIINECKKKYRSRFIPKIIRMLDKKLDPKINVLEAIILFQSAWGQVSAKVIQNCFRHSKLISAAPEDIDEDDVQNLFEDLNQILGQCEFGSFDYFANFDNELITAEIPSDDDIVDKIRNSDEIAMDDDSENEVECEVASDGQNTPINNLEALDLIEKLKYWVISQGQGQESEKLLENIEVVGKFAEKNYSKNFKQKQITDFFHKI